MMDASYSLKKKDTTYTILRTIKNWRTKKSRNSSVDRNTRRESQELSIYFNPIDLERMWNRISLWRIYRSQEGWGRLWTTTIPIPFDGIFREEIDLTRSTIDWFDAADSTEFKIDDSSTTEPSISYKNKSKGWLLTW